MREVRSVEYRAIDIPVSAGDSAAAPRAREGGVHGVLSLGQAQRFRPVWAVIFAIVLHLVAAVRTYYEGKALSYWTHVMIALVRERLVQEVDFIEEPLPEPELLPPEPLPPEPVPEPVARELPPPARSETPSALPEPAAARAGATLVAEESEPVDLANTIVLGNGEVYAGGVTDHEGTSEHAVTFANARGQGHYAESVPKAKPPPRPVEHARRAACGDRGQWQCELSHASDEYDFEGVEVLLDVRVEPNGTISRVDVLQDPGHGFASDARRCAEAQRCTPAEDPHGTAIATTRRMRITFTR